jgi:hypothetical protein
MKLYQQLADDLTVLIRQGDRNTDASGTRNRYRLPEAHSGQASGASVLVHDQLSKGHGSQLRVFFEVSRPRVSYRLGCGRALRPRRGAAQGDELAVHQYSGTGCDRAVSAAGRVRSMCTEKPSSRGSALRPGRFFRHGANLPIVCASITATNGPRRASGRSRPLGPSCDHSAGGGVRLGLSFIG